MLEECRSRSLALSIRRAIKGIVVIIEAYHICKVRSKNILLSKLAPYAEEVIGNHEC
jgi:hypothetical protein